MKHNDEYKAVDFMLEVGCEHEYVLENLRKENYEEICLYLINRVRNLHEPDDKAALGSLYLVCLKLKDYPTALRIAFCLNSMTVCVGPLFGQCSKHVTTSRLASNYASSLQDMRNHFNIFEMRKFLWMKSFLILNIVEKVSCLLHG
ncbi:hypothetical protein Leryth_015544, partial [Lithospermum erythrorhizon]